MSDSIEDVEKKVSRISRCFKQIKRIWPDVAACIAVMGGFYSGVHENLPPSMQLIFFKMVLVSMAFVHAHIVGKLAFGEVEWQCGSVTPHKMLRVALYVSFIIAYSMGG